MVLYGIARSYYQDRKNKTAGESHLELVRRTEFPVDLFCVDLIYFEHYLYIVWSFPRETRATFEKLIILRLLLGSLTF